MAQDCPKCRLVNPATAQRCDCGYDFVSHRVERPYFRGKDVRRVATTVALGIAGAILAIILWQLGRVLFLWWLASKQ